ncbi:MAG: hypothetical protein ACI353_04165 [Alloprevotella sp.]
MTRRFARLLYVALLPTLVWLLLTMPLVPHHHHGSEACGAVACHAKAACAAAEHDGHSSECPTCEQRICQGHLLYVPGKRKADHSFSFRGPQFAEQAVYTALPAAPALTSSTAVFAPCALRLSCRGCTFSRRGPPAAFALTNVL